MRLFACIFFLFFSQLSKSQILIEGRVFDVSTGNNLAHVNVYIENTPLGVISNSNGIYRINLPEAYLDKKLVFSILGYGTFEREIINFNRALNSNNIGLKSATVNLEEFIISAKKISIDSLVRGAFKNFYSNFPNKPFISNGFLRHVEKTRTEFKWLLEAAIEVYDPGFNKHPKGMKTNVIQVRKSLDNRYLDTLSVYKFYMKHYLKKSNKRVWSKDFVASNISEKELRKAISYYDNYFTLQGWKIDFFQSFFSTDHNKIRYFNKNEAVLDKNFEKKHSFKLDTILITDNQKTYKIKILPKNPPANLNRFKKDRELPLGWIFIRSRNLSISELTYTLVENKQKSNLNSKIFGTKLISLYHIKFKEFQGHMYPHYMSLLTPKGNRFIESLDGLNELNKIDNQIHYYTKQEILFTNLFTQPTTVKTKLETIQWNNDLFTPRNYNNEFWENYNVLLESSEELTMRHDLEKNISLKEQFKKNNK